MSDDQQRGDQQRGDDPKDGPQDDRGPNLDPLPQLVPRIDTTPPKAEDVATEGLAGGDPGGILGGRQGSDPPPEVDVTEKRNDIGENGGVGADAIRP